MSPYNEYEPDSIGSYSLFVSSIIKVGAFKGNKQARSLSRNGCQIHML